MKRILVPVLVLWTACFLVVPVFAAEPALKLSASMLDLWRRCTTDSECEAVQWGSCTVLSINPKFQKEVIDYVRLQLNPARGAEVPVDSDCVTKLRDFVQSSAPPACQNYRCIFRKKQKVNASKYKAVMSEEYRIDLPKPAVRPPADDDENALDDEEDATNDDTEGNEETDTER
jgi:hypothetical protein